MQSWLQEPKHGIALGALFSTIHYPQSFHDVQYSCRVANKNVAWRNIAFNERIKSRALKSSLISSSHLLRSHLTSLCMFCLFKRKKKKKLWAWWEDPADLSVPYLHLHSSEFNSTDVLKPLELSYIFQNRVLVVGRVKVLQDFKCLRFILGFESLKAFARLKKDSVFFLKRL